MRETLLAGLSVATPEKIADAFDAAVKAAYTSTPQHGYEAALAVLTVPAPDLKTVEDVFPVEPAPTTQPTE
jgi:hypothetical protein